MDNFIIDETTNTLTKYDFPFTNAHLQIYLFPTATMESTLILLPHIVLVRLR